MPLKLGLHKSESPDTSIIAAGDFNPVSNVFNPRVINTRCNLKQVVKHPARNSVILDLIMSDIHKFYQELLLLAPIGGSDHCTIVWSSKVQLQPQKVSKRINVRPLKSSLLVFELFIKERNWSGVLSSTNVNDKVNSFLEEVSDMVDFFFPLKSIKVHEDDKPYIN